MIPGLIVKLISSSGLIAVAMIFWLRVSIP